MKFYNLEQQKMANQRVNYENQLKKLRNEQKDFELQRKRAKEQMDKQKEEDMSKIRAQKRMLE